MDVFWENDIPQVPPDGEEGFAALVHVSNGAIALPGFIRKEFPEKEVYIGVGADRCLRLYTRRQGETMLRRCGEDPRLRVFSALLCRTEIRDGGLMTVPEKLLSYAGIGDKAVVELTSAGVIIHRAAEPGSPLR